MRNEDLYHELSDFEFIERINCDESDVDYHKKTVESDTDYYKKTVESMIEPQVEEEKDEE